jgi:signal transduction histidine kinase
MTQAKFSSPDITAKIAVVDDSELALDLLCALLSEQGHEVLGFSSGAAEFKSLAKATPDLVLLDVNMPEMDGFEVCEQLKKLPQFIDVPIIFISSLTDIEDKIKAFQCGGVDYVTKPIEMAEVTARIRIHLNLRKYQTQLTEKNTILTQAMSELKSAQSYLVQSEKMASLGQLVAGVAHEINNPVSVIYGNVHIMQRNMVRLQRYIDCIHQEGLGQQQQQLREQLRINHLLSDLEPLVLNTLEATERTRDIVTDLRTFSSGNTSQKEDVNLVQAVDTASRWVIKAKSKRIKVITNIPEQLRVYGHLGQLTQVMINLLQNAVDVTAELTHPSIEIKAGETEHLLWLSIADNGSGIIESDLGGIFDPFFTTKPVGQGTGLGLSISYSIIKEHGGELSVANSDKGGAVFRIELPRIQD